MVRNKGAVQLAAKKAAATEVEEKEMGEFDWKKLTVHPLAEIFPSVEGDERVAMGDDIEEYGLIMPIWWWKDPKDQKLWLIDGKTRLALCLERNIKLEAKDFVEFHGNEKAVEAFVFSANDQRRHLAALKARIKKAEKILEDHPKWSDRKIGRQALVDHKTVGAMRKKVGNSPEAEEAEEGNGGSDDAAAKVIISLNKAFTKALKAWDDEQEFKEWIEGALEEAAAHFHPEEVTVTED